MPEIVFIDAWGSRTSVDDPGAATVMRLAVDNNIPGVVGQCGGNMFCGTCHVILEDAAWSAAGPPHEEEEEMLRFLDARQERSRLGCQVAAALLPPGAVLHTPADQPGV